MHRHHKAGEPLFLSVAHPRLVSSHEQYHADLVRLPVLPRWRAQPGKTSLDRSAASPYTQW